MHRAAADEHRVQCVDARALRPGQHCLHLQRDERGKVEASVCTQAGEGIGGGLDERHRHLQHKAAHEHHAAGDVARRQADERVHAGAQVKCGGRRVRAGGHLCAAERYRLGCARGARGVESEELLPPQPRTAKVERGAFVLRNVVELKAGCERVSRVDAVPDCERGLIHRIAFGKRAALLNPASVREYDGWLDAWSMR